MLDSQLLAEVWLAMTRGQDALLIDVDDNDAGAGGGVVLAKFDASGLPVVKASEAELAEHETYLATLDKSVGGEDVYKRQTIHTDSQYVMKGMTEWLANWKRRGWMTADKKPVKNAELWQALDDQVRRHTVSWRWVRGHAGDPGNERADQLANQGVESVRRG